MERKGNYVWKNSEVFAQEQIETILNQLDISIKAETQDSFLCLCPFHYNTSSPALSIDKEKGIWACFNPSCNKRGNLLQLVQSTGQMAEFPAKRFIEQFKHEIDIEAIVRRQMAEKVAFEEFDQELLDKARTSFRSSEAYPYMQGRGFEDETLRYFDIGFYNDLVIVPMHDPGGMPVGYVGRSIIGKQFKNSWHLPKNMTAWNFHRAKKESDTVIICESSFDAMRIWQAGYRNVVALLGGSCSKYHVDQLSKSFSTIIIMTDNDQLRYDDDCNKCAGTCQGHNAGRDLGESIQEKFIHKKVLWAYFDEYEIYPHNAKDAGDMTDQEIRQCLMNATSSLEYYTYHAMV